MGADALSTTLLGNCSPPRVVDAFIFLNARTVASAELTRWQHQATLHEVLGRLKARRGAMAAEALPASWQAHAMRRFCRRWRPGGAQLAAAPAGRRGRRVARRRRQPPAAAAAAPCAAAQRRA
jgi:hypothetical protein